MAVKRPVVPRSSTPRTVARKPAGVAATRRAPAQGAAATPVKARAAVRPGTGAAPATGKPAVRKVAAKTPARGAPSKVAKAAGTRRTVQDVVLDALDDMKAIDVKAMDVRGITDITDTMVVASGTSDRHVKSIADRVVQRCKEAGFRPYGMEGERDGEWVLLDLHDVVLHVMLPRVREFYALEKLWESSAAKRA